MVKEEQRWYCPTCEKHGVANYEKGAAVYDVINLLEDSHNEISPECTASRMRLQVLNEDGLKGLPLEEQVKILSQFGL